MDVWNTSLGTFIVYSIGTVPGYWISVALIEYSGRKPIQYFGFSILILFFLVMAGFFVPLTTGSQSLQWVFIILYAGTSFFYNFGPNTTTFVIPAEAFPTQIRSTAYGVCAATGKLGAIVAVFGFSSMLASSGIPSTLYMFGASAFVGLLFSVLVPETKGKSLEQLAEETTKEQDHDITSITSNTDSSRIDAQSADSSSSSSSVLEAVRAATTSTSSTFGSAELEAKITEIQTMLVAAHGSAQTRLQPDVNDSSK